jgi:ureidoacrylate peracid hydrolase
MHKISIPEEIIDACIKRRGRPHVYDTIDPYKTALVVIDMQNSWVAPNLSVLEIPEAKTIVPNINSIGTAIRNAGGVVAWTKSTFDDEWTKNMYKGFCDEKVIDLMMSESKVGSFGFEIWDEMDLRNGDIISEKNRPSALIQGSSDLDDQLRSKGIETLIITGTLTNACCESTTRDAVALGYNVIFVSDGTATRSDFEHNATLVNLMQLVADVRNTADVISLINR